MPWAVVWTALAALGLREAGPARAPPELARVEFAGCAAVTRGPVCELGAARALRFWLPGSSGAVVVTSDRGVAPATARGEVQGGRLVEARVPEEATELWIEDGARGLVARLRVAATPTPPWAEDVQRLRDAGNLTEARAVLEATIPATAGAERARATGMLARVELARGLLEPAVAKLYEAIALDREAGLRSAEADDSFALAFTLDQRLFRYTEARAVLARVAEEMAEYPEGRARQPYYEGLVVADTNDVRGALLRFADAEARAERLGMTRLQRNARSSHAQQLAALGRRGDALAALEELAATSDEEQPCDRIDVLDAIGAWTLRTLEVGGLDLTPAALAPASHARARAPARQPSTGGAPAPSAVRVANVGDAEQAFTAAAALFPSACADVHRHADVLLGLADVALRRGSLEAARTWLGDARRTMPTPRSSVALAALAMEARIALAADNPEGALAAYAKLELASGAAVLPEWEYTTALGRGETYEAMGRLAEALVAYRHAEALVDHQSLWIPLEEGRSTFLADRGRSARLLVDLLLRMGRNAEALASARASRLRVIAAFERTARVERLGASERARWEQAIETYRRIRDAIEKDAAEAWKWSAERFAREKLVEERKNAELRAALESAFSVIASEAPPASAPSPPAPGELVVVYHPIRDGWVGFGLRAEGLDTFRFQLPGPSAMPTEQAERLLGPLRVALDHATRLRILPYGPLRSLDFHALPWEGGPLLARLDVVYGIDAPTAAGSHAGDARRSALVVADPTGDLPGALREARGVVEALRASPGASVRYLANEDADSVRVRELLPQASLFHYAGHGSFAGRGGLESALALAAEGSLTVGDILALPHAPATVVLSGCETGRAANDGVGEGLGLAHAFVLAGSHVVLAPVRPVEDALAAQVSAALYHALAAGTPDAASALRDALLKVRARAPESDWAAFRAVTP